MAKKKTEETPTAIEGESKEPAEDKGIFEPVVEPEIKTDVDVLLAELESAGIKKPEELQGKLRASREAGQLAQMLGEARDEIKALKKMMSTPKRRQSFDDDDDYGSTKPIQLDETMESVVERVLDRRDKRMLEMQRQQMETWSKIRSHKTYPVVGKVFEQRLQTPDAQMRLQSGEIDPMQFYNDTVLEFYEGLVARSADTIKTLKGSGTKPEQRQASPHIEGQASTKPSLPSDKTDVEAFFKGVKKQVDKGTVPDYEDELNMVDQLFK